jgi:hypothetical protein
MSIYAALVVRATVRQVIVGDASWANSRLRGPWVGSDVLVGIGWTWTAQEGFRPPKPYPSWLWDDGWQPPVPAPDGDYMWDEGSQTWVLGEELS